MTGDREIDRGENSTERLIPLSQTKEFKVARGDPNVTGWEVVSADGVKIGTVHDLIVDVPEKRVRYLDVNLDSRLVGRVGHGNGEHRLWNLEAPTCRQAN